MRHLLIFVALALHSVAAAAAQRTFVASNGSDMDPCSITQPCRAFAAAMPQTDPDGEIIVLDSAGYGAVTVDKSVSIIAPPGVYAGISVFAGNGVTISAGASDKVVLRGLTINGQGSGIYGIVINQAAQVEIQRCVVSHMGGVGIYLAPGASKVYVDETRVTSNFRGVFAEAGDLVVTRSQLENNAQIGLWISPASALTVQAVIRASLIAGNTYGVVADANGSGQIVQVTIEDTAAVRNVQNGFLAQTSSGGVVTFVLSGSVGSRNGGVGFDAAGAGTTASVSGSTLARNYTFDMRQQTGAVLRSHGNNALSGDGPSNISGTITQVGLD